MLPQEKEVTAPRPFQTLYDYQELYPYQDDLGDLADDLEDDDEDEYDEEYQFPLARWNFHLI